MNRTTHKDHARRDRSEFLSDMRRSKAGVWVSAMLIVMLYGAWVGAQV